MEGEVVTPSARLLKQQRDEAWDAGCGMSLGAGTPTCLCPHRCVGTTAAIFVGDGDLQGRGRGLQRGGAGAAGCCPEEAVRRGDAGELQDAALSG